MTPASPRERGGKKKKKKGKEEESSDKSLRNKQLFQQVFEALSYMAGKRGKEEKKKKGGEQVR